MRSNYMLINLMLLFSFSIFCFGSCGSSDAEKNAAWQETMQRTSDSIARVQAYQDSIIAAERLAARLADEEKQRKMLDSKSLISVFAGELVKEVSPGTKEREYYEIDSSSITYDRVTKTLIVPFEVGWYAFVHGIFDDAKELHLYKGKIYMYGTGETKFETVSENQALIDGIKATQALNDLGDFIDKYNKEHSDKSGE